MKNEELALLKKAVQFVDDDIAIKPACEFLGLAYQKQQNAIKNDEILGQLYTLRYMVGADNRKREMFCVPKDGFLMWIYSIQINRVTNEESREILRKMKMVIREYLFSSEQRAKIMELYVMQIKVVEQREQELKETIAACGRELKSLYKEKKTLLASDPNQLAIEFTETKSIA